MNTDWQNQYNYLLKQSQELEAENHHLKQKVTLLEKRKHQGETVEEKAGEGNIVIQSKRQKLSDSDAKPKSMNQLRGEQKGRIMELLDKNAKQLVPFENIMTEAVEDRDYPQFDDLRSLSDFTDGFMVST